MSRILFVASHASDDPTLATLPFELAVGATKEGHEAEVALLGESVNMMKNPVAEELHGFGCPVFREVLSEVIEHHIPVYV